MLKKLFYIGLGFSIIVAKKSVSYLVEGKDWASEQFKNVKDADVIGGQSRAPAQTDGGVAIEEVFSGIERTGSVLEQDDLTKINGIGPTYAKRLTDAGVKTFVDLSERTPNELRTLTKATGNSADTESWIIQAREMAI
jgi:predicted flap endonuclease-1-like 5' DNA nuclease